MLSADYFQEQELKKLWGKPFKDVTSPESSHAEAIA
jgi:hypothetical protein